MNSSLNCTCSNYELQAFHNRKTEYKWFRVIARGQHPMRNACNHFFLFAQNIPKLCHSHIFGRRESCETKLVFRPNHYYIYICVCVLVSSMRTEAKNCAAYKAPYPMSHCIYCGSYHISLWQRTKKLPGSKANRHSLSFIRPIYRITVYIIPCEWYKHTYFFTWRRCEFKRKKKQTKNKIREALSHSPKYNVEACIRCSRCGCCEKILTLGIRRHESG